MYADTSGFPHFGHHHHKRRHNAAAAGFGVPGFIQNFYNKPAGKLLISAVPGGATALEAHAIAKAALADGSLNPDHLEAAGKITKAARAGHKPSIAKIAKLKHAAGKGNPHAEVAMDRLKLADSIQNGRRSGQTTTTMRNLRNVGIATLPRWASR